jgi:hypothetical protein
VGPTLPAGSEEAVVLGNRPENGGIALLIYRGPDNYPLRFAHLLVEGRTVPAVFRFSAAEQSWSSYITGAPSWVNTLDGLNDGDTVIFRFAGGE